jgi:hypothetical protein
MTRRIHEKSDRRSLSSAVGTGLLIVLLISAGCIAGGSSESNPTPTEHTSPPPTATESPISEEIGTNMSGTDASPGNEHSAHFIGGTPSTNISIGTPADLPETSLGPPVYLIKNTQDTARTIHLQLVRDGEVVLNRTIEFPADGLVRITVFRPGNYTLEIEPSNSARHVIDVPLSFDCGSQTVNVGVHPDGTVSETTYVPRVPCKTQSGE